MRHQTYEIIDENTNSFYVFDTEKFIEFYNGIQDTHKLCMIDDEITRRGTLFFENYNRIIFREFHCKLIDEKTLH